MTVQTDRSLPVATQRFGVGVIGLGVGERLARAFAQHPDCRLVALCDTDSRKLSEVNARQPTLRTYEQADALIDDPDVSLVVVASPDDAHYEHVLAALRRGKHVFAEKPLVMRRKEAQAIRDALQDRPSLRLTTNTILRMSPRFRLLQADIAAGKLGDIFLLEADYNYGRLHKLTEGWRGRIKDYSVMLGGGIHMIDLVLWLSGQRVIEVSAMGGNINSRKTDFAGDDLTVALLRLQNGAVAKIGANFGCVEPHFHRLTVYGTAATFENSRGDALLWESRDLSVDPRKIATEYPGVDKGDLVPSFIDGIVGRGKPEVDEDAVFAALSVGFAIDDAKRTGRTVAVEYI